MAGIFRFTFSGLSTHGGISGIEYVHREPYMNQADVEKIAHLARLAIDEKDVARYARDLSNILDLVRQMEKVDTNDVAPMSHPMDVVQRLRPDEITEVDQRQRFQQNAPLVDAGLYLVPKVIE